MARESVTFPSHRAPGRENSLGRAGGDLTGRGWWGQLRERCGSLAESGQYGCLRAWVQAKGDVAGCRGVCYPATAMLVQVAGGGEVGVKALDVSASTTSAR